MFPLADLVGRHMHRFGVILLPSIGRRDRDGLACRDRADNGYRNHARALVDELDPAGNVAVPVDVAQLLEGAQVVVNN